MERLTPESDLDDLVVFETRATYGQAETRTYRDLRAWQAAMELAEVCYLFTRDLPSDEAYGLRSQIRRAAVSIPANLAEGWGRDSHGEFDRFLGISGGSLRELETELLLCKRFAYGNPELLDAAVEKCDAVGKLIYRLRQAVQKRRQG